MQLDRRHLATAARSGAVGGKTTNPRIHSARGRAEVAPNKGHAPPRLPAMPSGTCSSRCRRARRVAGGGARLGRGAARRADWAASAARCGAGGSQRVGACVARAAVAGGGAECQ